MFVQPLPPDETIAAAAYGPGYANYAQPGRLERLLEPLARREARRLLRYADPDLSLLELGCGTGRFLERLRAVGWRGPLAGLEHSPAVAAAAAERLGIPIEAGDAESVELSARTQGAIVLRHVLEHLREPAATLERVRAALAADGVLYLATPDRDALAARVFGRWWWGWEVPRHLAVFSPASLRLLLRRCGFSVEAEWRDPDPAHVGGLALARP